MNQNKEKLKYRMYGLVPYNISPIQQGIQFGHAVVEYVLEYVLEKIINGEEIDRDILEVLYSWAKYDKTFIVLNGGTTNFNPHCPGTLNNHKKTIAQMCGDYAIFTEPDLGDQLTAVIFLVDERVWDKEKYPDLMSIPEWQTDPYEIDIINNINNKLLVTMGGKKVWEFRLFLSQFRFA